MASKSRFSLEGKVVLVAGAAGILGPAFCRALAAEGAEIAMVDLSAPHEQARQLTQEYGCRTRAYAFDLTNADGLPALIDQVEEDLGAVAVLHANAATKGKVLDRFFDTDEDYQPEVWREIMGVNLDATFFLTRTVGSRMAARGTGSIILTSSIYGLMSPDQRIYEGSLYMDREIRSPAVYSASKAGVVGLVRHFAGLWGHRGVRVNAIAPGGVSSGQNALFSENYSRRVPLGRMAQAEEMTGALVFLASDAASYVTGQVLAIDGGLSCW